MNASDCRTTIPPCHNEAAAAPIVVHTCAYGNLSADETTAERLGGGGGGGNHGGGVDDTTTPPNEPAEEDCPFPHRDGLTSNQAALLLAKHGRHELSDPVIDDPQWLVFVRQLWAPLAIAIWIAVIIEAGNFIVVGCLLLFQFANATARCYEITHRALPAVAARQFLRTPPAATGQRHGPGHVSDDAAPLAPGGAAMLVDGRVHHRTSEMAVDPGARTGESTPPWGTFHQGDSCELGATVGGGEIEATVVFTGPETLFGKTASRLRVPHEQSHLRKILMTVMFVLVGLSVMLCIINFIYLLANGVDVHVASSFSVVILVVGIPLAMEIVTTTTLAIGANGLAKRGIIVAKLSAIEDLACMAILCIEKTGTSTLNQMKLQVESPTYCDGNNKESVLVTYLDPRRLDTKQTIKEARQHGVQVKTITGDHLLIARNAALQLDRGDKIITAERLPMLDSETKEKPNAPSKTYGDLCLVADGTGFAQVFFERKYFIVESFREMHFTVGMTGDGVDDAPALKRADIGIAVAGATDAARAAADLILTQEGLGSLIDGIVRAREILQRICNFITYRTSATLQLLLFSFIAGLAFRPNSYQQSDVHDQGKEWPEFFHMPVLMLMLVTLLNDGALITIAYDYAKASETPSRWNLKVLFFASSVLAAVSCVSSLLLLWFLLDSWNPNGLFKKLGLSGVQYGRIIISIYLKVSVSDFLTLFSARAGHHFFWKARPAPILLGGGIFALTVSSLLAIFWPESTPDGILTAGLNGDIGLFFFVWIFCLISWFIQDICKVLAYKWMHAVNFCNIHGTGVVKLPEFTERLIEVLDMATKEEMLGGHR